MTKKLFSISDEVATLLAGEKNQSAVVDTLLHMYFDLPPTRGAIAEEVATKLRPVSTVPEEVTPAAFTEGLVARLNAEIPEPQDETILEEVLLSEVETTQASELPAEPCEHGILPPVICIDCI